MRFIHQVFSCMTLSISLKCFSIRMQQQGHNSKGKIWQGRIATIVLRWFSVYSLKYRIE